MPILTRHLHRRGLAIVIIAGFVCSTEIGLAQEAGDKAENKKPLSQSDEDLARKLLGEETLTPGSGEDPLEAAIQGMRDAHQRIGNRDTGRETQAVQKDVIANLRKLLEMAQQNPPRQPNNSPPPEQNSDSENSENEDGNSQPMEHQNTTEQENNPPTPQTGDGTAENPQSSDTNQQQNTAAEALAEQARRQAMVNEVWGHLPPSLRERLLNVDNEKILPQYEELVRRYFEALAEPERSR